MRSLIALAMTCAVVTPPTGDDASVTADIELSEWTPAMRLSLNIVTGDYTIRPTTARWPRNAVRPEARHGTLTGEASRALRAKFVATMREGVAVPACVEANGQGYPGILSNAGVPRMTLDTGKRRLQSSPLYGCWTRSADDLYKALTDTFDRKTP